MCSLLDVFNTKATSMTSVIFFHALLTKGKLKHVHMRSLPPTSLLWKCAVHWDDFYSKFLIKMSSSGSELEGFFLIC